MALLLINSDNQEMEIAIISPGKTICMRKKTYCMRKKSSGAEKVKTLSVSYFYWVMQGLGGSYGGSRGRSQSRLQSIKDCVKLCRGSSLEGFAAHAQNNRKKRCGQM